MTPSEDTFADLTYLRFVDLLHSEFQVLAQGGAVALTLAAVTRQHDTPSHEQFTLLFLGPHTPQLPQRIYEFEHPALGRRALFAVPVGQDKEGNFYEVIFNRLRGDRP